MLGVYSGNNLFQHGSCTNRTVFPLKKYQKSTNQNLSVFFLVFVVSLIAPKYQESCMALRKCMFFTIYLLSTAIVLPLLAVIMLVFWIYRQIITLILHLKHGSKFLGITNGADTIWAIEDDNTRSIINAIVVVESAEEPEGFCNAIKKEIHEKIFADETDQKLLCTREKFLGYNFLLLGDESRFDMHVRTMKFPNMNRIPQNYLQEVISLWANSEMPANNKLLWQCVIFENPLNWSNQESKKQEYGILFRIHHSLADGFSLVNFLLANFSDFRLEQDWITTKKSTFNFRRLLNGVYNFVVGPGIVFLEQVMRKPDRNPIHGQELCGRKIVTWAVEDVEIFLPLVKQIKHSLVDCSFLEVIIAGISASLSEYFATKGIQDFPRYITAVIPAMLQMPKNVQSLRNNFTVAMLKIPVFSKLPQMITVLKECQVQTAKLSESPDFSVNRWLLTSISSVLPEFLLKHVLHSAHSSMVISNLPGTKKITIFNGSLLKDIVFWIPNRGTTGVGFSILTYDHRFQMGLMVDRNLMREYSDANFLIYGIFKYILKLHSEIMSTQV